MSRKTKGICFIILSAFCFALMNTFVRLSGDLPSMQKSFFRNLVAMLFALVILLRSEGKFQFNRKNLPGLLTRSICGTVGILCNYYAVDHLLLSDASMLGKLAPFFAIIFSYVILKEKVTPIQCLAIVVAFCGSLFIIKPGFSSLGNTFPALIATLGALGAGIAGFPGQRHAVMAALPADGVGGSADRNLSICRHGLHTQTAGNYNDMLRIFGNHTGQILLCPGAVAQEIYLCRAYDSLIQTIRQFQKLFHFGLLVSVKFLEALIAGHHKQIVLAFQQLSQFFICFQRILGIVFQFLTFLAES